MMSESTIVRLGIMSGIVLWLNGMDQITTRLRLLLPVAMAAVDLLNALYQPEQAIVDEVKIYLQLGCMPQ